MKIDGCKRGFMLSGLIALYEVDTLLMHLGTIGLDFENVEFTTLVAEHESIATNV